MLLPNSRQIIEPCRFKAACIQEECRLRNRALKQSNHNQNQQQYFLCTDFYLKMFNCNFHHNHNFKISLIWDFSRQLIYTVQLAGHTCTKEWQCSTFPYLQYHRRRWVWLLCSEWEEVFLPSLWPPFVIFSYFSIVVNPIELLWQIDCPY